MEMVNSFLCTEIRSIWLIVSVLVILDNVLRDKPNTGRLVELKCAPFAERIFK